jgi:hypothetical protein
MIRHSESDPLRMQGGSKLSRGKALPAPSAAPSILSGWLELSAVSDAAGGFHCR